MRTITKVLLIPLMLLCAVQGASAFNVSSITIDPPGDLSPGETVTVHFTIEFSPMGGETFESSDRLQFYSELKNPRFEAAIVLNGIANPPKTGGTYFYLSGFELSYPDTNELIVEGTLQGTAPEVSATSEKKVLEIKQQDSTGKTRPGSEYSYALERTVINPADVTATIQVREEKLDALRSSLDQKVEMGVNVTAAEQKYDAAVRAVDSAKTATYAAAMAYLSSAQTYIDEAENLLDKAWAEKEIGDAGAVLESLDGMINYFTVNRSMGKDARVLAIVAKFESATQYYTAAKDYLNAGNYPMARSKASEAETKATEAYNDAVELKAEIGEGFDLGGNMLLYIGIGIVIVLVVVGVVVYRRKTRWDELG